MVLFEAYFVLFPLVAANGKRISSGTPIALERCIRVRSFLGTIPRRELAIVDGEIPLSTDKRAKPFGRLLSIQSFKISMFTVMSIRTLVPEIMRISRANNLISHNQIVFMRIESD